MCLGATWSPALNPARCEWGACHWSPLVGHEEHVTGGGICITAALFRLHYSLIRACASCRAEVEARNVEALVSAGRLEDAHAAASALFTLCADAGLQARVSSCAHARAVIRV